MDTQITATVTFSDWHEEQPSIEAAIIKEAARLVIRDEKVKARIEAQVLKHLDDRVNELFTGLFDREVQPTDRWGNAQGQPVRIDALLQQDAEKWLMAKVDSYGSVSSSGYHNDRTRLEYLVQKLYKDDFKGFFTNAVKQGVDAVKKSIRAQIDSDIKAYLKGIASTV
jgi:hypothetical protein